MPVNKPPAEAWAPSRAVVVQIVQINQPYLQENYLPYVAGLLQAYVQRHARQPARFTFLPPLFERLPLQHSLMQSRPADVVAFSCYTWNWQYSLQLAAAVRAQQPGCLIVFGGPHVPAGPQQAEAFLRQHPAVNLAVHGEGEQTFLELLEQWQSGQPDWQAVAGISYLDAAGDYQRTAPRPRQSDLSQVPSPYLTGVFEPLLRRDPGARWLALWETNRGCPFSCSFCDWGSATASKVSRFDEDRLLAEIEWFARQRMHTVYCCDANYGMLKRDLDLTDAMVRARQQSGFPKVFYIQNTKNVTERAYAIQTRIAHAGLNQAVTLSLQSVNPRVLKHIQRDNISLESYRELQQRFRRDSVQTYTDMLVGLPGDTPADFLAGIDQVINEGQHHLIRFYNVYLLPNAPMNQPDYRARHQIQSVVTPYAEPLAPTRQAISEFQELVIASESFSSDDWLQMRMLAWWAELLYFNRKLLQLPWVLLKVLGGLGYGQLLQHYLQGDWPRTAITAELRAFLQHKAQEISAGQPELCPIQLPGKGEVWMGVEDYLFHGLSQTGSWPLFFADQQAILLDLLHKTLPAAQAQALLPVLQQALQLSQALLGVQLQDQPFEMPVNSNFWAIYQAELHGETPPPLSSQPGVLYRDWHGPPFDQLKYRSAGAPAPSQIGYSGRQSL